MRLCELHCRYEPLTATDTEERLIMFILMCFIRAIMLLVGTMSVTLSLEAVMARDPGGGSVFLCFALVLYTLVLVSAPKDYR